MNIQIFGTKKCKETQKTERFFKERAISYHFIDLTMRGPSKGELDKMKAVVGLEALINREGKEYAKSNLKYIIHNKEEVLFKNPLLLKTPIVRNGAKVTIGYCPDIWLGWE